MTVSRRFAACRGGMAATEFALVAPVLAALFFGIIESADALAKARQVTLAADTLADLAAQESRLETPALDDLFSGVEQIVGARELSNEAPPEIRLVSVTLDADGDPIVHWSRDNDGGEPYAPGAPYDKLPASTLIEAGAAIIVSEIDYTYTSKLTRYFISGVTFERSSTRWPRRSTRVRLCTPSGNCW